MKMVSVEELDNSLIQTLQQLKMNKDLLAEYIKQEAFIPTFRDKDIIKKEIQSLKKKIDNLTVALENNTGSSALKYIIQNIEKLDNQLTSLNYELREAEYKEQEANTQKINIDTVYSKICEYIENFDSLPYVDKVKYLQDIIKECTWDWNKLQITI